MFNYMAIICSFCSFFANIPSFGGAWGGLSLGEVCLLGRSVYKKQLLMKRDNQLLSRRNRLICEMFFSLLREGMPAMRAYAATGNAFFLSEAQVRRIVSANA